MPFSALVVPVPELDQVVRQRLEQGTPPAEEPPLAHITLLAPFAGTEALTDGVSAQLAALFADVVPFGFELSQVCQFPAGTVYLDPDPVTPFRQLTHELWRRFPEHPPYEGRFDDVVPHLTLPLLEGETLADVERELAPRLPIRAHAREALLYWVDGRAGRLLELFPFGTAAA